MSCPHLDFVADVTINRLFTGEDEDRAETIPPESVSIEVRARCAACDEPVRFEGTIGMAVGPGAPPRVSVDGLELRAAGHLGENRSPSVGYTVSVVPDPSAS